MLTVCERSTDILSISCVECGIERKARRADVERSRYCRPCGIRKSWDVRGRKTPEQKRETQKAWYKENREYADKNSTAWREQKRLEVIEFLGGKCNHCGIIDPIVLHIDHVNDDGAKERKQLKRGYAGFLVKILNGKLPKDRYQLLCCNCNWRKEYFRRKKCLQ
jgi:hypothetical protein